MIIIELKDCNILNIYNSFTDGYYDEDYYGCPTCGGADVPDTFTLQVISDKFDNEEINFFEDEAKNALRNFLPWILKNKDNFKDVSFYEFVNGKVQELAMEEIDEINK
ncbi:hypothetical protein [Streptococcus suis]|uniref:hypothetical protein n=1 Tax=Streptococcus suis TaxID=1307 RepID=UPI000CF62B6B|nr:hypothetical protein [Streptococcus suis]